LWFKKIDLTEVKLELDNQLLVFKQNGLTCAHLNSHQNVHCLPPFESLMIKAAKEQNISLVRGNESVLRRLRRFPVKLVIYQGLRQLLALRYGDKLVNGGKFLEDSLHPGTNYDWGWQNNFWPIGRRQR
jgi:predicted glycoside hydrolase/deacetylase ChbG (UPF0249 family)